MATKMLFIKNNGLKRLKTALLLLDSNDEVLQVFRVVLFTRKRAYFTPYKIREGDFQRNNCYMIEWVRVVEGKVKKCFLLPAQETLTI